MLKTETLSQLKQLKRDIKASRNLHTGVVKGTSNKFGFVTLDSGKDIFLPAEEMAKVLPGDRIEVEVKKEPKNKTFAIIERLIESPTKEFFGKYVTKGNAHFVEADIPGLSQWFFIPPPKRNNAKAKDLVRCRLSQHPIKSGKAQASVLEVLGAERDPGVEWVYTKRKYQIEDSWPQSVEAELETITEELIDGIASERQDLCALPFVTIDSASTQDIDDALYVEKLEEGWLLRVAIADPASVVKPGSAIEKELCKRATSIYFPGQVVPMLPAKLSRELCSLKEGEKRLAQIVELNVGPNGELLGSKQYKAAICSHRKLSYQEASELCSQDLDSNDPIQSLLLELDQVSKALERWRLEFALLQSGRQEYYLELNEQKKIAQIVPKHTTPAHRIVEECMVAANRAISIFLRDQGVDSIFVGHEGVRSERKDALTEVLKKSFPELEDLDLGNWDSYRKCMQFLNDDARKEYGSLLTRQLARATLSSKASPHFAMGLECYTTFTSPLRKAADFLLHRQLQNSDSNLLEPIDKTLLTGIDDAAQRARASANEVEQWLKCQFMNTRSETMKAVIVRVFASGCQIRLIENGIEGFISTRDLDGKFSYNQDLMQLKGAEISFRLDQELSVKKKQIDWSRKQIMFVPSDG